MQWNIIRRLGLRALILAVLLGLAGTSACLIRTRPAHQHHVKRGHAHGHHKPHKGKKYKKQKKYKKYKKQGPGHRH
jgi:hypothetical protein